MSACCWIRKSCSQQMALFKIVNVCDWLTLKPSSVRWTLHVVMRLSDLKFKITLRKQYAWLYTNLFCKSLKLKVCQTSINYWDDDVVISGVRIFHRHPSFKEKSLLVIWLMSADVNIVKVHMMMVLVDMTWKFQVEFSSKLNTAFFELRYTRVFSDLCVWS